MIWKHIQGVRKFKENLWKSKHDLSRDFQPDDRVPPIENLIFVSLLSLQSWIAYLLRHKRNLESVEETYTCLSAKIIFHLFKAQ